MSGWDNWPDDYEPVYYDQTATEHDAHLEWHRNTGVPLGTPGCPQDACHRGDDEWEAWDNLPRCGQCGEPLGNEHRAEVVRLVADELKGEVVGDVLIIHQNCFRESDHEIA